MLKKEIQKINEFVEVEEPYIKLVDVTASWSSSTSKVNLKMHSHLSKIM